MGSGTEDPLYIKLARNAANAESRVLISTLTIFSTYFLNSELSDVGYTMALVDKIGEKYPSYSRV
jgi:hypothetical protein